MLTGPRVMMNGGRHVSLSFFTAKETTKPCIHHYPGWGRTKDLTLDGPKQTRLYIRADQS